MTCKYINTDKKLTLSLGIIEWNKFQWKVTFGVVKKHIIVHQNGICLEKIIIDVFNSRVFLNQTYVNLLNENVHVYFQTNFLIKQD